jgi:glycosyltransferase involved in cell wall biosynthesis
MSATTTSVAYVTTTFPTLASFIENEVHALRGRGVRVAVFTLGPVGTAYQPEHQALVGITRAIGSPLSLAGAVALVGWTLRRPHVLIPDVARILWASRSSLYALAGHLCYLPAAARLASLLEREGWDRVHGAWAHFPGTVAYLAARLTGRPLSLAAHAGADLYRTQAFLGPKVRAAEFVAACVRGNAEMLRALGGDGSRVEWIYHGVDLRRFDGAGRARDPEPLLLAVGRLGPAKGFADAVEALGRLKRRGLTPRFVLVGEGPERARIEALAREHGVDGQVTMTGAMTHRDLLPLYRRAWMLVAPSRVLANGRRDGIPNVVVEAMAMGVACVGTRAAGLEEAIVPGETGALCAPGDPDGLADAIASLLEAPAELDRMSAAARARALRLFDFDRGIERLIELFGFETADARPAAASRAG